MKSYVKSRGWLFPLRGGPHTGIEVRLPWPTRDVEARDVPLPISIPFPDGSIYSLDHVPDKKPTVGEHYLVYVYNPCWTAEEMERHHGWRAPNFQRRVRQAIKRGRKLPAAPCSGGNHACSDFR